MENASKALIIAGSILVSIVIITLGVMIVNNVRDTINNNSNLSAQEVTSYNSEFLAYEGIRSGTQVRALLQSVQSHNNVQSDESRIIKVQMSSAESIKKLDNSWTSTMDDGVSTAKNAVKAGYTYKVDFGIDSSSGLIIAVGLTRQNAGT